MHWQQLYTMSMNHVSLLQIKLYCIWIFFHFEDEVCNFSMYKSILAYKFYYICLPDDASNVDILHNYLFKG